MCTYSMIADHYIDKFKTGPFYHPLYPGTKPQETIPNHTYQNTLQQIPVVSRQEFEDLKRQVMEMKELLLKAKAYDEKNNEPDCEMAEKVEILTKIAKIVGVDLKDVVSK